MSAEPLILCETWSKSSAEAHDGSGSSEKSTPCKASTWRLPPGR
jgi:hypothetical protein